MPIEVLIADDHAVVRRGIREILSDVPDIDLCGEVSNAEQVLAMVRKRRWDALVLDLSMPGMSGLDLLYELKRSRPELPILILSVHDPQQYAVRMIKAGASGYLTKESAPEQLVAAIRKIAQGGRYLTPETGELLADHLTEPHSEQPHLTLSDREFQVMSALASGKRIKDIATDLSLSPKTISTYRRRALEKLGLETDAELVQYAIRQGLVLS